MLGVLLVGAGVVLPLLGVSPLEAYGASVPGFGRLRPDADGDQGDAPAAGGIGHLHAFRGGVINIGGEG
ncbi:MAG: hypothetical protein R2851_25405 [Caldilineaceae bacterium]